MTNVTYDLTTEFVSDLDQLAPRERAVLEFLHTHGNATATDIEVGLQSTVSNSTIRKMLSRLVAKQLVTFRQDGARYIYRATTPRRRARRQALEKLIRVFFGGSPGQAAIAALDKADAQLTDAELDELETLVKKARRTR